MVMAKNLQAKKEAEQSRIKAKPTEMKCGMTSVLDKMSETNRKEMLAGLFLSKFNTRDSKAGLERLGYTTLRSVRARKCLGEYEDGCQTNRRGVPYHAYTITLGEERCLGLCELLFRGRM